MLKKLASVNEYMDFVNEINSSPDFSEPMLSSEEQIRCNLLDVTNKPMHQIWGIFEKEEIVGLSRVLNAYEEMLAYLKENYKGYRIDFVYNPDNYLHNIFRYMQRTWKSVGRQGDRT